MSYCGFAKIISVMYEGLKSFYRAGRKKDFIMTDVFRTYSNERYFHYDDSAVSRWFNGSRNIDTDIGKFYTNDITKLYNDIKNSYFKVTVDFYNTAKEIYCLVKEDVTISEPIKNKLLGLYKEDMDNLAIFISEVLIFSMGRNIVPVKAKSSNINEIITGCTASKPCKYFVGRNEETEKLKNLLNENNCVFIEGIGEIGKSEFVRNYIHKCKNDYTNILYLRYSENLKNVIANIIFLNDSEDDNTDIKFCKHFNFLKTLKDDTLVVIDNFDTTIENEPLFDDFINNDYKIVFTSRSEFSDFEKIKLAELDNDEMLLSIINHFYEVSDKNKNVLVEIIGKVHKHTFSIELVGRLLKNGLISPNVLLEKLSINNVNLHNDEKFSVKKDGKTKKAVYYNHLQTLFRLFDLSEKQKYIMTNFCFVSVNGVDLSRFAKWICEETANDINTLVELGFIRNENRLLYINEIMRDMVFEEFKPSVSACKNLIKSLRLECLTYGLDKFYYNEMFDFIENMINKIFVDNTELFLDFIGEVFSYADKYNDLPIMKKVITEYRYYIKNNLIDNIRFKGLYYMFKAIYLITKYENDFNTALKFIEKGISIIKENVNPETKHLLGNLYSMYGSFKLQDNPKTNKLIIMECYQKAYKLYEECGTLYSYDGYCLARRIATVYASMKRYNEAIDILETFAKYFKPNIIPNSREEFNFLSKEKKLDTITEYTELICDIYAIKKFIGKNAEYEKQIMGKIENMSVFGVCTKFKINS